jgi:hypothetical protein
VKLANRFLAVRRVPHAARIRVKRRTVVRLSRLAAVCAVAATASLWAASPAQAVYTETYQNYATGDCLDSNWQGHVYAIACNGGNYQKWIPTVDGYGFRRIQNYETGRCLDSNFNGDVYTLPCNGGLYQSWIIVSDDPGIDFVDAATWRYLYADPTNYVGTSTSYDRFNIWQ